ncbi:hypothetical protein D0Z70_06030 [Sphingobium terrigena]|uniref:Beta-hexosaminidase bacterial type N-terminal domain-containing protein n=1 Tax=Sphingobium terrigena TaxID=2304063 RepID=A0A418YVJ4_9SPHN|nr:hypothetical protein [Sphingobium terrigena]RJG56209.1 hypothetical protein D0Z70_06030 [Sphingobium terrigena]
MSLVAALMLATATGAVPAPVALQSVCVEGEPVAAGLLRQRLAERGARAAGCGVRVRMIEARGMAAEAFRIDRRGDSIMIRAKGTRGLIYGAGWVLRHTDGLMLRLDAPVAEQPRQAVRGTQIGYRFKNNSYDAWTPAMLRRRIEDFALWGANRIQIIAPRSDDAPTSPLMPVPPEQAVAAMAGAAAALGLDVAIFYPALEDYDGGAADAAEAARLDVLLRSLPKVDALYIPGGDPGHSPPDRLFPLARRLAAVLRGRFPKAELLLSTQGFDAAGLDAFYTQLVKQPRWLSGIFVGPQTRESVAAHLHRIAGRYPVELYPDTAHAMQAQLPVPDWHPAFALTQGREPVNPRPAAMQAAFDHLSPGTRGAVSYSEGVNDDWNVHQWLALGWKADTELDIAKQYSRFYIGDLAFATIPAMLEANWRGDPADNVGIDATLDAIDRIKSTRWQADLYRYRAVYDALVRARLMGARARQAEALYTLRQTPGIGPDAAVAGARFAYARPDAERVATLHERLVLLADQLWTKAGMQLSVARHGASHWRRGANLDRAMIDLNDRVAVERDMTAALALATRAEQVKALVAIGDRWGMADLALYDDLGDPGNEPHLVRGPGYPDDPQLWRSAIDGVAGHSPDEGWRMAELSYAEALYEQPLMLHYEGLEKNRAYRLRYTWAGEDYVLPLTLTANGVQLPAPPVRSANPQRVELAIPQALTAGGTLDLSWTRPPGIGGGGRGRQIAEVWLIPQPLNQDLPNGAKP